MRWFTETNSWIPFYGLLITLIIWKFRWKSIYILITIALLITACDQFTSSFMKPFFGRLRPCHDPIIQNAVHLVTEGCGGKHGFASSHAANTFGLAMFLWLLMKPFFRYMALMFLWAALVSYSRVYVGVHYPGDILIGGLVGVLTGWVCYRLLALTKLV